MDPAQRKDENNVCNKKAPKKGGEEKKKERNERKRWDFQGVLTDLHFITERLDY